MESKITINGKEYSNEELQNGLKILAEKLGDKDMNNIPDILDRLQNSGVKGKILYNVAKNYLNQKTASGEPVVTILNAKLEEFSNDLKTKDKLVHSEVISDTGFIPVDSKQVSSILEDFKKPGGGNIPLNVGTSPFAKVLIYLSIAGIITAVIIYVKYSFGF